MKTVKLLGWGAVAGFIVGVVAVWKWVESDRQRLLGQTAAERHARIAAEREAQAAEASRRQLEAAAEREAQAADAQRRRLEAAAAKERAQADRERARAEAAEAEKNRAVAALVETKQRADDTTKEKKPDAPAAQV